MFYIVLSIVLVVFKNELLFFDVGVYTKNRNFRLFLSSKLGKVNPLVLAKDNQFHVNDVHLARNKLRKVNADENLFLSSLVCHVE